MSGTTVLLLHGINDENSSAAWIAALDRALTREGHESLSERDWVVRAPRYFDLLAGPPPEPAAPTVTYRRNGDAVQRAELVGAYWASLADLERALADLPRPSSSALTNRLSEATASLVAGFLEQADKYRRHEGLRHAVMKRILVDLPDNGELIVLAHSLGSVVLADLLLHLPPKLRVTLVVTMGSPLSHGLLRKHLTQLNDAFPFEVAGPWVNLVGHNDPVTASRGVSAVFPEIVDVFVDNGAIPVAHEAVRYLEQDAVVRALGWVDRPQHAQHEASNLPDVPMTDALLAIVVGMQYALRVEQAQNYGEKRARYAAARRYVADQVAAEWRATGSNHPVLGRLLRDNAPIIKARFPQDVAVTYLLTAWQNNVLRPFEIDIDDDVKRRALMNLAMDLELPSSFAETIIRAHAAARSSQEEGFSWLRAGVIAVGVVTVLAAPALVFAVAPAGLAGGAALVAGLAALGPGGMLGGLAVVSLVGGVGGSFAVSALTAGSSGEVIDVVTFLQARAKAMHDLRPDSQDRREWQILNQMSSTVANDLRRHQQVSDRGSNQVKEAERKLRAIRRALEWMGKNELDPPALPAAPTMQALTAGSGDSADEK